MASNFQICVNQILQSLGLPYVCMRRAAIDGNCFYDSVLAVAFEDPALWATLRTKGVTDILSFRHHLATFMRDNTELHALAWFKTYQKSTRLEERNRGLDWNGYLRRIATTKDYVDQLTIMCTALFCGKDIVQVSEGSRKEHPWTTIPGQVEGWPHPVKGPPITLAYLHKNQHYEPIHRSQPPSIPQVRPTRSTQPRVPNTPTIPSPHQQKSPGKRKQAPTVPQAISPRSTRSQGASPQNQDVTTSQPKSPKKEKKQCKVCGKEFELFVSHLKRSKKCGDQYDVAALDAENKMQQKVVMAAYNKQHREEINEAMKKHYKQHTPEKRAASKEYYDAHTPEKRAAMREYSQNKYDDNPELKKATKRKLYHDKPETKQTYYQKHKDRILARMAKQRKLKWERETEKERFIKFHEEMKNVFAYGCLCCHRTLVNTKDNKIKGGIEALKRQLDMKNPSLFKNCFIQNKKDLPKGLQNGEDFYLCNTCSRWLIELEEMPPMCYRNGLMVDKIPPELEDLHELETILISKRIIFIKIFFLPTSRWHSTKDQTVNVPIDDDTIRETLDKIKKFPRMPNEAGLIPIDLKRKVEYKNTHKHAYVNPDKMIKAAKWLKQHHRGYTGIEIQNRYSVLEDKPTESDDSVSEEEDEEAMDCIRRNQFNLGGATMLTNTNPEEAVVTNLPQKGSSRADQSNQKISVAPGEGKIPTSLTQDDYWDVDGFPKIFPTGEFGLHHQRDQNLSFRQFFEQRFENVNKRFCNDPAFVFAALYYIEKRSLENAMSISFRRGKIAGGKLTNLEDACCVFDNQPGSFRYWQKRRYEVIAKLEQLGPFQFFFTLSCADQRWDENFVAMLQQKGLQIIYKGVDQDPQLDGNYSYKKDNIFIKEDGGQEMPLREFLAKEKLHEMVRQNVLTITMIFDKRVQSFMNKIVMSPGSPMRTKYYHYRVEFQKRGAGHIHGVLWVDLKELEEKHKADQDLPLSGLQRAMVKLRNSKQLDKQDKTALANFVDRFVSCSLEDNDLAEIVRDVQRHSHKGNFEKKTGCFKKGPTCRFNFPRFPSERTIIAQPLVQKDGMTEREFDAKKKETKEILEKVKNKLIELTEEGKKECTLSIDDLLKEAKVEKNKYYEALQHSKTGACIILKRQPNEAYINNYNPEWIKAWDGNMDISACLDFFAIITYITDYYTKSETSMMKQITAAVKTCKGRGDDMKAQVKHLVNTFLTSREMGEMEAWYRIIPRLNLSKSNVKCEFVATGFPENRSSMVMPVKNKMADPGNDDRELQSEDIELEGSDKKYKMVTPIHKKYEKRPKSIENMCLAQFAISYDMIPTKDGKKKSFIDGSSKETSDREDMKIVSWNPNYVKPLPKYIKLEDSLGYMRLRERGGQSVLRRHKIREDKNPHEYYYSELLQYLPWKVEEKDLFRWDLKACRNLFVDMEEIEKTKALNEQRSKIEKTREKLFPYMASVDEGRAVVAHLDDQRPTHIGEDLDPQSVVENEVAEEEGLQEDEDHLGRFPNEAIRNLEESNALPTRGMYKILPLPKNDSEYATMRAGVRSLDDDQRAAFNIFVKYVKQERASTPGHRPDPVFLKVHGGAGSGKSHLINVLAMNCEYFLRIQNPEMEDSHKPGVIKMAPTGKAAVGIDGMTMHQAFNFPWGIQHISLSEQLRVIKRNVLSNLKVIIIDEMSMVKPDQLYQLHMRLQEIKQNKRDFGGVSILLCGDLLQLPPVLSNQIFEAPKNQAFRRHYEVSSLWDLYDSIELTHNHRQAGDWLYAELLNRVRMNNQTEEDLKLLATKISPESPVDAVYCIATRAMCREHNVKTLALLPGRLHIMMAILPRGLDLHINDEGEVGTTSFMKELQLKVDARVMLIHNVDTMDSLSNGTCGYVRGFVMSRGEHPEIMKVRSIFCTNFE